MRLSSFFLVAICLVLCVSELTLAQTQYQVLYSFGSNSASDGAQPRGTLVLDEQGNLYGTTGYGGNSTVPPCSYSNGCGTVFELSPTANGSWTETVIYEFCSASNCADGSYPTAGLVFDNSGNLNGTTSSGGNAFLAGTVFELSPPSAPGAPWMETVLWAFGGNLNADGCGPDSKLIFDSAWDLYGTTVGCGAGKDAAGTAFELIPTSNGTWTENLLHTFRGTNSNALGGVSPTAGLAFDQEGNLYGTTSAGGKGSEGVVYELSPKLGGGWVENVLHSFSVASGAVPLSSVSIDPNGNVYGTLSNFGSNGSGCGANGCGGIFRVSNKSGTRVTSILALDGSNGGNPAAGLFLAGNTAYGTTQYGGANGQGVVFTANRNGIAAIYSFCSQANCSDGSQPVATLTPDGKGNYYGVTSLGGAYNQGVVFEITP